MKRNPAIQQARAPFDAISLSVGFARWTFRQLSGHLVLDGRPVQTIIDFPERVLTITERTSDKWLGHAVARIIKSERGFIDAKAKSRAHLAGYEPDENLRFTCPHCGRRYETGLWFGRHVRKIHKIDPANGKAIERGAS